MRWRERWKVAMTITGPNDARRCVVVWDRSMFFCFLFFYYYYTNLMFFKLLTLTWWPSRPTQPTHKMSHDDDNRRQPWWHRWWPRGTITKLMTADSTVTMSVATRERQRRHPNWETVVCFFITTLIWCLFLGTNMTVTTHTTHTPNDT
jgi:hypothetical protein